MKTETTAATTTIETDGPRVWLMIGGKRAGIITSNWDCTEVQERLVASALGTRGADYAAAFVAHDVRAMRRTWRLIGT